jgi:UDP-galactopyranose mutase
MSLDNKGLSRTYRYYNMDQVVAMALTEFKKLREGIYER